MPGAVIVDAIRTPIGRAAKGSLKDVRADDLAAAPLRALVERNPEVDFAQTVDVMLGCGFAMGEAGYNVGRNAALLAGLDHHVPATNRQPLLRILVADTADGLSRERPARATNSCRRRRSGQPLPGASAV
jgi:acetyl-CoA acetyltransferase